MQRAAFTTIAAVTWPPVLTTDPPWMTIDHPLASYMLKFQAFKSTSPPAPDVQLVVDPAANRSLLPFAPDVNIISPAVAALLPTGSVRAPLFLGAEPVSGR